AGLVPLGSRYLLVESLRLRIHEVDIMVWAAAGGVNIQHVQAVGPRDKTVCRARRQTQEVTYRQRMIPSIEDGDTVARKEELVFLRPAMITAPVPLPRLDVNPVNRAGPFLLAVEQRLDAIRPQVLRAPRIVAAAVDQIQRLHDCPPSANRV